MADLASYSVDLALVELAASTVERSKGLVEHLRYEINLSEYNQIKKLTRKHTLKRAIRAKVP